jgi:hypothetical protein
VEPATLLLLLAFCRDLATADLRALTPEDLEVVRQLELLENLELLESFDLELFVGPPGESEAGPEEAAVEPDTAPPVPTAPPPAPRSPP